ncbi:conjugal transfer protein TraX [Serratia marcescens]|uniref:conjugal transfer protein TraX n=1 Tax=Serratia TaxID=613 RepID=UPI002FE6890B
MTDQSPKSKTSWKRASKGLYFTANLFLPLSELRYAATKIGPSLANNLKRSLMLAYGYRIEHQQTLPALQFEEAVAASGESVITLINRFRRRKHLCLALGAVPILIALSVVLLVLGSEIFTPTLLIRTATLCFTLFALAAIPLLQAFISTWRLWQLRNQRLSKEEAGSLTDFLRENTWWQVLLRYERPTQ